MAYPFADVSSAPLSDLLSLVRTTRRRHGGAQGLGKAIALRLAEAGAAVAIADLDERASRRWPRDDLADRFGRRAVGVRMDVADAASVAPALRSRVDALGGIDIWVNNAGHLPQQSPRRDAGRDLGQGLRRQHPRRASTARVRPRTACRQGGVIVNVVSTAGFRGIAPGLAAYVASKHAARGADQAAGAGARAPRHPRSGRRPDLRADRGQHGDGGRRVEQMAAAGVDLSNMPSAMSQSLIGRIGVPDDIARVVLFCASDLSMFMTGSTLLADAGETI